MRLFVGMPVPAGQEGLRRLTPELPDGLRPVPDGSWHMTLRFLGDTEPDPVAAALDGALRDAAAMAARVVGLGAFSHPRRARILWAGVEAPRIEEVAAAVVAATRDLGAPPDDRDFRPHVTVGRARRPMDLRGIVRSHADVVFGEGPLDRVVLYASTLGPEGRAYQVVHEWRLPEP